MYRAIVAAIAVPASLFVLTAAAVDSDFRTVARGGTCGPH